MLNKTEYVILLWQLEMGLKAFWLVLSTRTGQIVVLRQILYVATNRPVLAAQIPSPKSRPGDVWRKPMSRQHSPHPDLELMNNQHRAIIKTCPSSLHSIFRVETHTKRNLHNLNVWKIKFRWNMQQTNHCFFTALFFFFFFFFEVVLLCSEELRLYACFENPERWCVFGI